MFPNQNAYDSIIVSAAAQYGLPFSLVKAIIAQESNFVASAYRAEPSVNDASYGLMQLLGATAQGLGYSGAVSGLYDPPTNIYLGAAFLGGLVRAAQAGAWDLDSAISAYNGGNSADRPGDGKRATSRVDGYVEDGSQLAPFINQSYVNAVKNYMSQFAGGPGASGGGGGLDVTTLAVIGGIGLLLALTFGR